MEKYYYIEKIIDPTGHNEDQIYYLEFEYCDIDERSFLLRTSGYRGRTYHIVRVTSNDTCYAYEKIGSMLDYLDMIYLKMTVRTFKHRDYIELEDINAMYEKLVKFKLIKKFDELNDEEIEIFTILKGELNETSY